MPKREDRNAKSKAVMLARNIKSIQSYVDDGVGWVEILFKGKYELAMRFEVATAVVKRSFLVQYNGGNYQLVKRFKITKPKHRVERQ
jgi:hypothetical protein